MGTVSCRERWDGFLPIPFGGWTSVLAMTVPAPAKRGAPPPRRAAEKHSSWSVAVWGGGGQEKLPWGRRGHLRQSAGRRGTKHIEGEGGGERSPRVRVGVLFEFVSEVTGAESSGRRRNSFLHHTCLKRLG